MKLLLVFSALIVVAAAQFNQARFPSSRRAAFLRFDDDFDDYLDDDHDSLEDLYEDLYDDDADDRAEARAALTRLRASGAVTGNTFRNNRFINNRRNNRFRSTGSTNNGFVNRFPSTNRFSTSRPTIAPHSFFTPTPNPTPSPFRSSTSNNRFGSSTTNRFGSSTNNRFGSSTNNRFGGPNNNAFVQPLSNSITANNPFTTKTTITPKFNSISSNRKTSSASSLKTLPSGLNWPGGNGYFFSMSTHGAEPVTYFIRYDD
ncbi:protein SGT1 homolog [Homarus americanus]|nr:protein SGT1 homolog [Homarus americanus]